MTEAVAAICPHLLPFCALAVVLDKGPTLAQAEDSFDLPASLKLRHNTDTHYDLENGLACETCKQSLSWLRHESKRAGNALPSKTL